MTKQIRDTWVLEVQEWLNKTYKDQTGFGSVPENGKTGWDTVNGLIRAIQIEMGLTPANNFGDGTKAEWDKQVVDKLKDGYKHNIVKIIDGAFRCKGMGNGKFDTTYNASNAGAIREFRENAGFDRDFEKFDSIWAKALFDMSAFTLVTGGNGGTREMQQKLNRKYSKWTGILPCDGIYQRATNTALIYGVQVELDLGDVANGNFGPATQTAYGQYANEGLNSYPDLVLLVQYGLYQNVKDLDIGSFTFSGKLDGATTTAITGFQNFMKLEGIQNGYPDLRTMMSLTLSNGDPTRSCIGCDTSHQLTTEKVATLNANGFSVVGRYLTGTVGPSFKPKALSKDECTRIFDAGMGIFAIYQDNLYVPKPQHFNAQMGFGDARKALNAARSLGIGQGETIYFAIDVDCQDWEITQYVLPYFESISEQLLGSEYSYGVYGTRNVCQSVENTLSENPPKGLFVSNMSSGFSGNLGFPQPKNWTFDQFYEIPGGIGSGVGLVEVDKIAVSGKDNGFSSLENTGYSDQYTAFAHALGLNAFVEEVAGGGVIAEQEYTMPFGVACEMKLKFHAGVTNPGDVQSTFNIVNGELDSQASKDIENMIGKGMATNSVITSLESIGYGIKTGNISFNCSIGIDNSMEVSLTINSEDFDYNGGKIEVSVEIGFKFDPKPFDPTLLTLLSEILRISPTGIALNAVGLFAIIGFLLNGVTAGVPAMIAILITFTTGLIDQLTLK
ncbi:glycoside hydrolase domain-containing protein [Enterococcus malodoratus]|uniref:glycoside hydrolase domain-containing protein n=1 Tax=Enterococcus malodoratus TaxID=71451 RepID=UPI0039B035AF